MAQEVVGLKVQVDSGEATQAIGSIKKQLREANIELIKAQESFGVYSKEAINAGKKVAELKDTIKEASEFSNLFDPGQKFQVFANAISAVAGGFTAVQGALGLVGVESKDVEKSLLRVQSALALSQGLSTIADSAKDFQRLAAIIKETSIVQGLYNFVIKGTVGGLTLQNVVTKATALTTNIFKTAINGVKTASITTAGALRVLRGVIAGLGIGALIFGVTALIDKIISWTASTDSATEAQKKLAAQTDLINAKLNNEIAILTAIGGKEDEVYRKKVEIANNELNLLRNKLKEQGGLSQEEIKKFGELKTQLVVLEQGEKNRLKEIREKDIKDKKQKDKEAADKAKAVAKERIDGNKDADEQIRLQNQENFLLAIKDEGERAKKKLEFDLQNRLLEIEALNADEEKKKELKLQALKSTALELSNLEEELKAKKKEKEEADKKEEEEKLAKYNEQNNERIRNQFEYEKKLREDYYQADLEATKYLQEQKVAAIESGLNIISSLAGKNEAIGNIIYTIQKAIEIGRIISSTTGAIAKVKADTAAIPAFVGPGIPNPAFAAALAVGTKKILGLKIGAAASIASLAASSISKFKSGSSGGNVGGTQEGGAIAGAGAPIAPPTPQATLTQLDQSINRLGSATNRAYVVESDITNSQERIRRINRAARLN